MGLRAGQYPKTLKIYDSYEAKGPIAGNLHLIALGRVWFSVLVASTYQ